ncbi:M24 family metallopeptidase [Pseudooceanicola sp. GBMRC 2024]|uniref:M24 family metallopeptidase n=1 Tax=Pseudooceanicola albus TaxID=2692189 RepID=A0A6L7G0L9_9RHOB|nr:Xaa-Pro peptidase family protein [Pseudooceanicola albus]MXN17884.1 M24 family metallopeptidase [Pseudooceanicola albus]
MSDLDRGRAARLMAARGIDALVLFQPEAFRYATGLDTGAAGMWRRGGASVALVPADTRMPMAAILADHALHFGPQPGHALELMTHPIWIDYVDYTHSGGDVLEGLGSAYRAQGLARPQFPPRPETFDAAAVFGLLHDLLCDRGLGRARIGVDLEFLPAADFALLRRLLPTARWSDGSDVLRRLRAIKTPREIACLRQASEASEAGLAHMAARARPGLTRSALERLWRDGAEAHAARAGQTISGLRAGISVGANLVSSDPVLATGDLVKADMGVAIGGYLSDGTRTFSLGPAPQAARDLFTVLEESFDAGAALLRPGTPLGEVHAAVLDRARRLGLASYQRGHFGHSVGASCGSEEWPFISAGNPEPIEPGMVLAFETPFYAHGLGALMIEDQFLITREGAEPMNRLPRGLTRLGQDMPLTV